MTLNLLFPIWDDNTHQFLRKNGKNFHFETPVDYPGPRQLSDFFHWRDRLSTLYSEFCAPPPSMTHLFYDRRNVLQWYTFWFAVMIVVLTIIFGLITSVTACLQTKYAYEALKIARDAAASSNTCSLVP